MSNDIQSIEDLMGGDEDKKQDPNDNSPQAKFQSKTKEIKDKEVERFTKEKADEEGYRYIDLKSFPVSPEALSKISEEESKRLKVVCFLYTGEELRLGAVDVTDEIKELLNELSTKLHTKGEVYIISENSFVKVHELYKNIPKVKEVVRGVEISEEELNKYSERFEDFKDLQDEVAKADVTQVVSMVLAAAIKVCASDIHIEREEADIKVRFRVDGILHDAAVIEKNSWPKIISRLKLLAKVKINIEDKPQDGRFGIFMANPPSPEGYGEAGRKVDIRASFLPTAYGESVVMRLLDSTKRSLSFEDLGLVDSAYEILKRQVERPNGMIITTGPTGSGKTTTLYSILQKLNQPKTKIITIEDPIEYQIAGINQSQASEKYTFAKGLRSIVRQDPDVIMVGEIRDLETAEIAIQAALTGHLVLSTIHTNDSSGTIPRFLSMGVKPFLLAPAINAMIGQRLVRRLCDKCKQETPLTEEQQKRVEEIISPMTEGNKQKIDLTKAKFFQANGCDDCQGIGYKGRVGIYEIMTMNAEIEKLIQAGKVSEYDIKALAIKNGMITMAQDGIMKAAQGITSVEEVLRVSE